MTTAEYDNIVQALTNYKVSLTDDNGNLRSTYDIIKDISDVAKELENTDPNAFAALAETLSGTRQQNVFSSIVDNFGEAEKAMSLMSGSEEELERSYEEFSNSTTARINAFKAAFTELSADIADSDLVKFFVDGGTKIVNAIDFIIGGMNKLGGATTILESVFINLFIAKLPSMINNIGSFAERIQLVFMGVSDAVKAWRSSKSTDNPISFIESMTNEFPNFKIDAISASVTAIIAVINLIKGYRENLAKEAEATAKESRDKAQELSSSVNGYLDGLSNLKAKFEMGGVSSQNLTNEFIEQLRVMGMTETQISNLIGAYSNLGDAIDSVAEKTARDNLAAANKAFFDTERSMRRSFGNTNKYTVLNSEELAKSFAYNDSVDRGISNALYDRINYIAAEGTNVSLSNNYTELLQYYYDLLDVEEQLNEAAVNNNNVFDSTVYTYVEDTIASMKNEMEIYSDVLSELSRAKLLDNSDWIKANSESLDELKKNIVSVVGFIPDQMLDKIASDIFPTLIQEFQDMSNSADGFENSIKKGAGSIGNVADETADTVTKTQAAYEAISKAVSEHEKYNGLSTKTIKDLEEAIPGISEKLFDASGNFTNFGRLALDSEEALASLAQTLDTGISFDKILDGLNVDDGEKFSDMLKDIESNYSILTDAQSEWVKEGKLTADTLKKIYDAGLSSYLKEDAGAVRVDTEAWAENTKAKIQARIANLENKNATLSAENDMLNGTMIQGATDKINGNSRAILENENAIAILKALLGEISIETENATNRMTGFVNAVNELGRVSSGLNQLDKIFADIVDGDSFDFSSLVDSNFTNTFGALGEAYEDFIGTIVNSSGDINAVKSAFDNLATAYVYNSGVIDNLTEENRDLTVAILEQSGVANAAALVDNALAISKGKVAVAAAEEANLEWQDVAALSDETTAGNVTKVMLAQLALEKAKVNSTTIDTSGEIDNLIALANTAGATISALQALAKAKALMADADANVAKAEAEAAKYPGSSYAKLLLISANSKRRQAQREIGNITYDFEPIDASKFKAQYGGGTSTNKVKASTASSGGAGVGSRSAGSQDTTSNDDSWFEREYKLHQHYLNMDQEATSDYLNWLNDAYKKAYDESIITLDDYYKYQEEVYSKNKTLFDDMIGDMEHQIALLERQGVNPDEIIRIYKNMQSAVHDQADRYRAMGIDENSDLIEGLQNQWWSYSDSIKNVMKSSFDEYTAGVEHQIELIKKQNGGISSSTEDIIALYKNMQERAHDLAEEYRALGLKEDNEFIIELQNQWWSYYDNIESTIKESFDEYISESKFAIESLKASDSDKSVIIGYWKNILSEINKQIEKYSMMGYDATTDIMRLMVEEAQSTKQSIIDAIEEVVSDANELVDGLESVYTTVTDAAKEYASTGFLSVDSLQSILALGPQYLQFLYNENGQLVINEQSLQRVIAAKTEDMAAETALSYAKQVLVATESKEVSTLEALTNATFSGGKATWDMAYATIGLARAIGEANGISSEYYDTAVDNITKIQSITKTAVNSISAYYKTLDPDYISQSDALNKIIRLTEDLVKWENDQKIDALEKQKKEYADIIEQKKEEISLNKKIRDHEETVAEKIEKMAKLEAQIKQLALDDTREAASERKSLEEELSELQKDLADTQADYAIDARSEALDAELKTYQDSKDEEIEALKNSLNSAEKLYQAAINRINSGWDSLYDDLSSWNLEYGNELSSTLDAAWTSALEAAQRYGSFVDALEGGKNYTGVGEYDSDSSASGTNTYASAKNIASQMRSNSLSWWTASSDEQKRLSDANISLAEQYRNISGDNIYSQNGAWYHADTSRLYSLTNDEIIKAIVEKMKENSAAWLYSDESTRNALSQENITLGSRIAGLTSENVYRDKDGVWWIGSKLLYDAYHHGGIVGNASLKQNEVMAVLEKGEAVLDKKKEGALYQIVDFASKLSEKIGSAIDTSAIKSIFGSRKNIDVLSSLVGSDNKIRNLSDDGGRCYIDKIEVTAPVQVVQKLDKDDIKRHSAMIGELSAEYIKEGFRRRGLSTAPSIV